jgi:hypothetical protein
MWERLAKIALLRCASEARSRRPRTSTGKGVPMPENGGAIRIRDGSPGSGTRSRLACSRANAAWISARLAPRSCATSAAEGIRVSAMVR